MKENERSIAILMSTYNGALYIEAQIESILTQSSDDWTLYIRDDGSTDNTTDIINRYTIESSSIVVVGDDKGNMGYGGSFIELLRVVNSKYYMFCDQDDVWLPQKIERSLDELKRKELLFPEIPILVYVDTIVCDSELNTISPSGWSNAKITPTRYHNAKYVPHTCIAAGLVSIFNRKCRDVAVGSYRSTAHDLWVAYCVLKHGKMFSLNEPLVRYRQHPKNVFGTPTSYRFSLSKLKVLFSFHKRDSPWREYVRLGIYRSFYEYLYCIIKVRLLMITDRQK